MAAPKRLRGHTGRKRLGRGALNPTVTVTGLKEAQAETKIAARKVKDLRPPLGAAAEWVMMVMREAFDKETGPDGVPWAPLAESTIRARIHLEKGGAATRAKKSASFRLYGQTVKYKRTAAQQAIATRKLRYATGGKLQRFMPKKAGFQNIMHAAQMGGSMKMLRGKSGRMLTSLTSKALGKRSIVFGDGAHYAGYHQTGTKKGARVMPARKWAPVELIGGKWQTIKIGPAGVLWDKIADRIGHFVLNANNEPKLKL